MKLCTFAVKTPVGPITRVGVATDAGIVDASAARVAVLEQSLSRAAAKRVGHAQVPPDMCELIGSGGPALEWVQEAVERATRGGQATTASGAQIVYALSDIDLMAPIPRPPGIACCITWPAHIEDSVEKGYTMMRFPEKEGDIRAYYKGNADSISPSGTTLRMPSYATYTDVECEMAAVIGVGGANLTVEQAREAIVGYAIFNDVSFREVQQREMMFGLGPTKGKDADGCNVLGPWLVTADEVGDPQNLRMSLEVNGEEKSSYNTDQMVWSFADLASYLTKGQTVHPGHLITSGCYPGGSALDLGIKLNSGDKVALKIKKLGTLTNTIG